MSDDSTKPTLRTVSVVLPVEQRTWLLRTAAARQTSTGEPTSLSSVVRSLIDREQKRGQAA
jgi:hypothetical protein